MGRHVVLGTGAVGMAVVDELTRRGEGIRVVNRRGRAEVPVGVDVRGGDVMNRTFLKDTLYQADIVYFCVNPPYYRWVQDFEDMQDVVLEAAGDAGAKLVAIENLYMYGEPQTASLSEDHPQKPHTKKGRVRAAMAEQLMNAHRAGRVRATAGRASDFFGPRVGLSAMDHRVFRPILAGKTAQLRLEFA